ncbi:hypothetical protein BDQ17DRAFT_1345652 [Cyathus striatus]|nr:hypothetical protein BDQ17DRAFT_1345652 [Cyathus striatus]
MDVTDPPENEKAPTVRRSSRKKHKPAPGDAAVIKSSVGESSKRKTRSKAGRLSDLPNQHLDILFEIFGYLHPYDLLKLARTTKDFRRQLLDISSRPIWRASLKNIPDLPKCPPGLTEPQWVNLVFSPHCHLCLCVVRTIEWKFRVRMCSKCTKQHLRCTFMSEKPPLIAQRRIGPTFEFYIPIKTIKYDRYYFDRDMNEITSKYNSLNTEEQKRTFLEDKKESVRQIEEHSLRCEAWLAKQVINRSQELDNIRTERRKAILRKIIELGYEEDYLSIRYPDSFEDHKLVKHPHPLTERASMVQYMEEMRAKRIVRERTAIISKRKTFAIRELTRFKNVDLPCTDITPEGPDFCDFPPVKALIEQPIGDIADEPNFSEVYDLLPDLIISWRAHVRELFISHLIDVGPAHFSVLRSSELRICSNEPHMTREEVEAVASLATTVFYCHSCSEVEETVLFYPEVLGHRCWTRGRFQERDPAKWSCSGSALTWKLSEAAARYIIELALMDPDAATTRNMDSSQTRFVCSDCNDFLRLAPSADDDDDDEDNYKPILTTFGWREAVSHLINYHEDPASYDMKIFDLSDLEDLSCEVLDGSEMRAWSCTHCRDLPIEGPRRSLERVKTHVMEHHDIFDPSLNRDYFLEYESPNIYHAVSDFDSDDDDLFDFW